LDSLSKNHRTVLMLREVEGMSYEEIAGFTGCNLGTVMSRLFHARLNMKKLLGDYLKEEGGGGKGTRTGKSRNLKKIDADPETENPETGDTVVKEKE